MNIFETNKIINAMAVSVISILNYYMFDYYDWLVISNKLSYFF